MFQEFDPVGLVVSNNNDNDVVAGSKTNTNKYFYQYIYDLERFNKITNIQTIIDSTNDSFEVIEYKIGRLHYHLIFDDAGVDTVTVLNELANFHIILNYYFELLYTQENLIKSVSNRITNTVNDRDLNKMITNKNIETITKEKDHLITLTKMLDHADRMNLLLATNYKYDNSLIQKIPLPKTLLSFIENLAKMTTATTKTQSRMLTNEVFIDVIETQEANTGFISGLVKLQTNLYNPVKDKNIIIKSDKFQALVTTFSDDKHGIALLKKYQFRSKNKSFPILVTYQYTADDEVTLKLNTANVKGCNTVKLGVHLPSHDESSVKVYNQGDLSTDSKIWHSDFIGNSNGTICILKLKKLPEMSLVKLTCSVVDGKGDSEGLNITKVHISDSNVFKGVKYTLLYVKELLIE